MVAGALDHETGTRDVTQLGGLWRAMPLLGSAAGLAALSFAGLPPLFGFISKELAYAAALDTGPWLTAAVAAGGLGFVFAALVAGVGPFWGGPPRAPKLHAGRVPAGLWLGPAVLASLGLLLGLLPGPLAGPLVGAALAALGQPAEIELALWHGLNPALWLSVVTLALGLGLYLAHRRVRAALRRLAWPWGPEWVYQAALAGLLRLARGQTRLLQSGYLRTYLLISVATTTILALFTLGRLGGVNWPLLEFDLRVHEVALAVLVLGGAAIAVTSNSRLGAVAALGITGYGVSLIYLVFGAPDLAMTQFLVESLTVILFVLVFYHLPQFARLSPRRARLRDAVIALLAGGLMTTLVLSAIGLNWFHSIAGFFATNAVPGGHGRNVVNVILVDFRGLDTLGEITVLSIAALGVFALLKLRKDPDA
jgi:multicomponent Na+:H+ antiporter subunit A